MIKLFNKLTPKPTSVILFLCCGFSAAQLIILLTFISLSAFAQPITNDPLSSWADGPIKKRIIEFVNTVTDKSSKHYLAPEDRIATFDNDGTLWVEKPIYTQVLFAFTRIKEMLPQHPEWKKQEPFKSVLSNKYENISIKDLEKIIAITHSGMTVDEFNKLAKTWLSEANHPRFKRHYTELIYQPMLEVMNYLRNNQFKIYIVSGGGQDFMRAFSENTYGVPPENVIGSAGKTTFLYKNNHPILMKMSTLLLNNDNTGKPEDIDLFIGKKPIIAFGNSTGDRQMLEWTQSNTKTHLMLLVHHDDGEREYDYGPNSKVGNFSNALMQEAKENDWQVVSMKNDWKVIFPLQ